MTDFPSPSGRPENRKKSIFAVFWPVLAAVTLIAGTLVLALGGLAITQRPLPDVAVSPAEPPPFVLANLAFADVELVPPPPLSLEEFKGFQMREEERPPEPPSNDPYELTLRLERGDTVEKIFSVVASFIEWAVKYVLLGAVVVVPIWLLFFLFGKMRGK